MKHYSHYKKLLGVGLIEVLITTVVISTGLLSVATMQGEFLGTSAENKIQEEAKNLCNTKIEQLRDSVMSPFKSDGTNNTDSNYYKIASSSTDDSITGVNEVYTRSWVVVDKTEPDRKEITATCAWEGGSVISQAIISFQDLSTALSVAANTNPNTNSGSGDDGSGGDMASPSLGINSSEAINDPSNIPLTSDKSEYGHGAKIIHFDSNDAGNGDVVFLCNTGEGSTPRAVSAMTSFDSENTTGLYTRRTAYSPDSSSFKEAIELFSEHPENSSYCIRQARFKGGVIISIKGKIFYRGPAKASGSDKYDINSSKFDVAVSESSGFCSYSLESTNKAAYICYIGGNCINGTSGDTASTGTTAFECPTEPDNGYSTDIYKNIALLSTFI